MISVVEAFLSEYLTRIIFNTAIIIINFVYRVKLAQDDEGKRCAIKLMAKNS